MICPERLNPELVIESNLFYKGYITVGGTGGPCVIQYNSFSLDTNRFSLNPGCGSTNANVANNYSNTTDTVIIDLVIYDKNDDLNQTGYLLYLPILTEPHPETPILDSIIPMVNTAAVSSITSEDALCGGNVTSDGGTSVTARGVCWSTSEKPTTNDNNTSDGTGTGSFTSSITGLSAGTTYHVRAYTTNSVGTVYGSDQTFSTLYKLTIEKVGTGAGTVTSSPAGIDCGSDCIEDYAAGTEVALNATPDLDSKFLGWSGDCSGVDPQALVTMDSNKACIAIFEPPPPIADLTGSPTSGNVPVTVNFTDQSTGSITSWEWAFGDDNSTSTQQNPSHIYVDPGSYTVSLTVTGPGGSDTASKNDYITANPAIGSLNVTLSPQDAIDAGAKWNADGGDWQDSDATVSGLIVDDHTVNYKAVSGWDAPSSEAITITAGQTTYITNKVRL